MPKLAYESVGSACRVVVPPDVAAGERLHGPDRSHHIVDDVFAALRLIDRAGHQADGVEEVAPKVVVLQKVEEDGYQIHLPRIVTAVGQARHVEEFAEGVVPS